jgi:hypothetical protein
MTIVPCAACKGINDAVHHLALTPFAQEAVLSVCTSCLQDAPTWAGYPAWPDYMKETRARMLREAQELQEVGAW